MDGFQTMIGRLFRLEGARGRREDERRPIRMDPLAIDQIRTEFGSFAHQSSIYQQKNRIPNPTIQTSLVAVMSESGMPTSPLVGVIMGSQSDLPTMNAAIDMLKKFKVPYEVDIVSAHRTPDKLMSYSRGAADRGIRVIIAGAGGAAHLPGMVAAMTPLPVVGVPVKTSTLSGVDSLYSIVQMPRGVPVATVAIGNAMNAGLLAIRILSTQQADLRQQMKDYQDEMRDTVDGMSSKLTELGSDDFLEQMDNKNKSVNV